MLITIASTFTIIMYILYAWILYYLYTLEKTGCVCAYDWRRDFTMGYYIVFFVLGIAALFAKDKKLSVGIISLMFIASIANSIIMLQYVQELKLKKCGCSEKEGRAVMQIVAIIQLLLVAIVLFIAVYGLLHIQDLLKNTNGTVKKLTKQFTK